MRSVYQKKFVVGIDEVGRGPLAGPVCLCAVLMTVENYSKFKSKFRKSKTLASEKFSGSVFLLRPHLTPRPPLPARLSLPLTARSSLPLLLHPSPRSSLPLRDSKKLSANMRQIWYEKIIVWQTDGLLDFCYVEIPARIIDKKGISWSIKNAVQKCLVGLEIPVTAEILLDGSLLAPKKFANQKTIIKGDEKEPIISLASIVAKVCRDEHMKKLSPKYPKYKFEVNKGYGTLAHRRAIKKFGLCKEHRKSYCRNALN